MNAPATRHAPAQRWIDGLSVIGYDSGSTGNPPVLLLHGIGGSARSCLPVAALLARSGIAAWCLDAAGYGESADPGPDHDVVRDALRVLEAVSPDRAAVLFGTSWGGVIAARAALRRPDRVAALVLADSTRGSGTSPGRAAAMRARIGELAERGGETVAAERAPRLTAPDAPAAVVAAVHESMSNLRIPGFSVAADFMANTDLGPRLHEIHCPTLVLVGEHDRITGIDESRFLSGQITGSRLHILAGAGHVAVQEQPRAIADLVVPFVGALS